MLFFSGEVGLEADGLETEGFDVVVVVVDGLEFDGFWGMEAELEGVAEEPEDTVEEAAVLPDGGVSVGEDISGGSPAELCPPVAVVPAVPPVPEEDASVCAEVSACEEEAGWD